MSLLAAVTALVKIDYCSKCIVASISALKVCHRDIRQVFGCRTGCQRGYRCIQGTSCLN